MVKQANDGVSRVRLSHRLEHHSNPRGLVRLTRQPVGGWYGLKKWLRGRFANYVPPVMEALGRAEVEHNARNNRMRAV